MSSSSASQPQIRQIGAEETGVILECARRYCSVIPWVQFNEEHYFKAWYQILASGEGAVFALEADGRCLGGVGGTVVKLPLTGKIAALEMFWYVLPEYRGSGGVRLLKRFEDWAREQGCEEIEMVLLECSMADKLDRFYQRSGYAPTERHYRKELVA